MSSHKQRKVNDDFLKWLNKKYGHHGEVTTTQGNKHEYLAMLLKFIDGKLIIDMTAYVRKMLEEFPIKFNRDSNQSTPAGVDVFNKDKSKPLNDNEREIFHKTTAQGLFLGKRGRPDLQPIISVLCT